MTIEVANAYVSGRDLVIVEKTAEGLRRRATKPEYSFFVRTSDLDPDFVTALRSSRSLRAMREEGSWTRMSWADEWVRRSMLYGKKDDDGRKIPSPFQAREIEIFEGDVDPVRRWFTDTPDAEIARAQRGYFDIESDSRVPIKDAREGKARILSLSLSNEDESKQWLGILERFDDAAERALIEEWFCQVDAAGYWQLLAWGGDNFDFACLRGRVERLGIAVDPRRYLWLDHLVLFRRMNLNSSDSGDEKQSMSLNAIAQAQLGEGKKEVPPEVAAKWPGRTLASLAYELWAEHRELLGRYNLKDTLLMCRIERKTGFVSLFDTLCDVCKVLPDSKGLLPTKQMDGFMLRLGLERDVRFPTKYFSELAENRDKFKGAYVMEPKRDGILRDVHVCDFASLYPSVIITWNMSPETKRGIPINGPIPAGHARSPLTGIGFSTEREGMLPFACRTMIALRKEWSEKQAKLPPGTPEAKEAGRRSMAYKVAVNSFYGVVGSEFSRFFDREVALSVTQNAVWLLRHVLWIFESWKDPIDGVVPAKAESIYGDTDSAFVIGPTRAQFGKMVDWLNEHEFPRILKEVGCAANAVKLAYEKEFSTLVLVGKKRYAGKFAHYKGTDAKPVPREGEVFDKARHSRPEIKGFEYKRGDCSVLARRLQERAINALMRDETSPAPYRAMLGEALAHVAVDDLPLAEIMLSKGLSKPTSAYHRASKSGNDVEVPPHVKVAEYLAARGKEIGEGSRVAYVIVDGSDGIKAIPAEEYDGEIDRYYLWENQVYPPTQRLLEKAFPLEDWKTGLERIRPPKKARALKGQVSMFATDPIAVARENREAAERHLERLMIEFRMREIEVTAWRE